jgi:hypothetical protein
MEFAMLIAIVHTYYREQKKRWGRQIRHEEINGIGVTGEKWE